MSGLQKWRARGHVAYLAFVVHRVSGVLLALFIPLHLWTLGKALNRPQALDSFLVWSDQPLVKFAETGLVLMLALHLGCGLRLLMLELLAWRQWQQTLAALAAAGGVAAALLFALRLA